MRDWALRFKIYHHFIVRLNVSKIECHVNMTITCIYWCLLIDYRIQFHLVLSQLQVNLLVYSHLIWNHWDCYIVVYILKLRRMTIAILHRSNILFCKIKIVTQQSKVNPHYKERFMSCNTPNPKKLTIKIWRSQVQQTRFLYIINYC